MSNEAEIVLIEDDPATAESLSEGLGREGYAVHWDSTRGGGVAYARAGRLRELIARVRALLSAMADAITSRVQRAGVKFSLDLPEYPSRICIHHDWAIFAVGRQNL